MHVQHEYNLGFATAAAPGWHMHGFRSLVDTQGGNRLFFLGSGFQMKTIAADVLLITFLPGNELPCMHSQHMPMPWQDPPTNPKGNFAHALHQGPRSPTVTWPGARGSHEGVGLLSWPCAYLLPAGAMCVCCAHTVHNTWALQLATETKANCAP